MLISDALSSSRLDAYTPVKNTPAKQADLKAHYQSSLVSLRRGPIWGPFEVLAQMIEGMALFVFFPFIIYGVIFTSMMSIVFLPFLILFLPLLIATQIMRELLYTFLPCFFPNPEFDF